MVQARATLLICTLMRSALEATAVFSPACRHARTSSTAPACRAPEWFSRYSVQPSLHWLFNAWHVCMHAWVRILQRS